MIFVLEPTWILTHATKTWRMCPYGDFFFAEVLPSIHAAAPCPEFIYTRFFSNPFPTIAFASFPLRDYCEKMPKNMKMAGYIDTPGLAIVACSKY